jgi:hypothetical protein
MLTYKLQDLKLILRTVDIPNKMICIMDDMHFVDH